MRLEGKTALIMGAGQSPGQGVGNGRATALLFAREGARVLCVDRDPDSAAERRRGATGLWRTRGRSQDRVSDGEAGSSAPGARSGGARG